MGRGRCQRCREVDLRGGGAERLQREERQREERDHPCVQRPGYPQE
jgi:hypothetical protein